MTESSEAVPVRGRIVMLVDNSVVVDSRVQKQARSAAAAGWDVTLLGQQRPKVKPRWRIGGAKVRLLEVGTSLAVRHEARRSAWWRSPLAYDRMEQARFRARLQQAKLADLQLRRARRAVAPASGLRDRLDAAEVLLSRAALKLQRGWTGLRVRQTEELARRRQQMDSPLDRATTAFWSSVLRERAWRQLDPSVWEWELAYGPVIDKLQPDLIHANDFRMLAVGARAAIRARAAGRSVGLIWDAHEFLPGIRPWNSHPRWHQAQVALEREFAPYADAVVTVSDELADLLVGEHGLATRPTVVPNAPEVEPAESDADAPEEEIPDLRAACSLGADQPLLVYSGVVTPARGVRTAVEALAELPGVHLALVVARNRHGSADVTDLITRAAELGVADRVHLLPYVEVGRIVAFLSGADVGLIPIQHFPNHEISLITKFYEYSQARLPIVVSDVKAMAETVRRTGQGEVFVADDAASLAAALRQVLADPERYRAAYDAPGLLDGWTWQAAARRLDEVYQKVMEELT